MSIIVGDTITVFDGLPHKIKIADGDLGQFELVVPPGLTQFQVNLFQSGDATDSTPRTAWVSSKPGYQAEPQKKPPPDGDYPEGQIGYQTMSVALNCMCNKPEQVLRVGMHGSWMEYQCPTGATLYITAANTQQGKNPNDKPQNLTITVSGR